MTGSGNPLHEWPLLLQSALDDLDQGISIFDGELRLVAWNRRFVELLDLPRALVARGARFADLARCLAQRGELGPGDLDELVARRVRAAERCARSYGERTTRAGRILAAKTSPLAGGGFVTVYSDITERSLAETHTPARSDELEARVNQRTLELRIANEELRRNEARLRLICDAIPAAIAYIDGRRTLEYANRRFAEMFDRTSAQVIGRPVAKIFGPQLHAELAPHLDRAFAGESVAFDHDYRGPDGKDAITRNMLIPDAAAGGAVLGLFVLSLDVTEAQRAERALHEAQKMSAIGQLAGGLAHDFNNLLTVIIGNLGSLRDRLDADVVREYVAPAVRAGYRGVDITRRLLAFARQQSLEPIPIDVPELVDGTARLLRRSLPATIAIECTRDGDGWPALADPAQLENAIVNLALNARDAMPDGGVLTFHTAYEDDRVELHVIDTGTGIAPELQERILEPFYTTKPFGSGSGLGLSMVFGFVQQSGGDLRITSEVGVGTCMTLILPRAEGDVPIEPVEDLAPATASAGTGAGQLVLLVEDDDDVRHAVRRQLVELGYQVLEAQGSDDARSLLSAASEISVLVSDVIMPGTTGGLGLADQARRLVPGIKIVLISGFANFAPSGYEWFDERQILRKPFGKDELARALARGPQ